MTDVLFFEPRTYRDFDPDERFVTFRVAVETSDLYVKALAPLERETEALIRSARAEVEQAIARRREFLTALAPLEGDPADGPLPTRMIRAARKAGIGPMAAVAGAVADYVGRGLLPRSAEVIIENGGDLFIKTDRPITVGVHAGLSPFTGALGVRLDASPLPRGLCASSGSVGPSLSSGKADAAVILSKDTLLADATATALGNRVRRPDDLKPAVEWAMKITGIEAALAIMGEKMAALGDFELVPLRPPEKGH